MARKKPAEEEELDLEVLMATPVGTSEEGLEDEYADDELAEEDPTAEAAVDPELMTEFEAFDDPGADPQTRAAALLNFVRLCKEKAY